MAGGLLQDVLPVIVNALEFITRHTLNLLALAVFLAHAVAPSCSRTSRWARSWRAVRPVQARDALLRDDGLLELAHVAAERAPEKCELEQTHVAPPLQSTEVFPPEQTALRLIRLQY